VIRILLADDQPLIRSGIRALLEAEDDIEVVGEAADGRQAVAMAVEHRPDIALVDIQMPVLDGLGATRQIAADARLDSVRVVILTNFGLDEYIFAALRAGATGFLLKDTQPAELVQALRVAMRGDALLSPAVTRRLISEFVARPRTRSPRRGWRRSPTGNARSRPWSRTGCPTRRLPTPWC
jgi:DNA-binding NarL/FixJ family response regulator